MKELPLTQGAVAVLDDEDWERVRHFKWRLSAKRYAARSPRRGEPGYPHGSVYLHRDIMQAPAGIEVDHIDGNTLDYRRSNLRLATHQMNSRNVGARTSARKTSRFKGVCWDERRQCWRATVCFLDENGRKRQRARYCVSELAAARAYNELAVHLFGEFARLNVVPEGEPQP